MTVTRIVYSRNLNAGKWAQLVEQATRLGQVRTLVWQRYGSIRGVGASDQQIRDTWMSDGTAATFGVLANAWKETVRDTVADIRAYREAAKVQVRRAICHRTNDETERKRTSQVIPGTPFLGVRCGDRLHCTECGVVWQADHAGAINVLSRVGDPDITLRTPHTRVKQILRERADRQRSRLPDQDSSTRLCVCGERNIHPLLTQQRAMTRKQDSRGRPSACP